MLHAASAHQSGRLTIRKSSLEVFQGWEMTWTGAATSWKSTSCLLGRRPISRGFCLLGKLSGPGSELPAEERLMTVYPPIAALMKVTEGAQKEALFPHYSSPQRIENSIKLPRLRMSAASVSARN